MSKVTFQAIFKQIYGDTPMAYQELQNDLAAVYFTGTEQSITQIAGELGYSNISKFTKSILKKCLTASKRIIAKQKLN